MKTDFDKHVLLYNFERRKWQRVHGEDDDDWNIYTGSGSVTSWVVSIIFFTFWFVAHLYSWFDTDP